ncbi:hydrolase [Gordonia phage NovaSharks]|uniref:Hydrolase n=1 Tax=Gordonia phage NovaSharks TaxID=2927258 RepID=A0A9E7Q7X8_9CAUD|nr:hydrolase [Gordonia phage NovaSharks]
MGNNGSQAFDNGKPIIALDIDGTLGDFHGHFLRFAESWYGRPMPDPSEINPGLPLHKFMQTSKATYRQCKLAYRQGGLKRSMPAYPGASGLTRYIRQGLGAEVWICTTRPYLRLDNIDPDTRHWLRRNHIQYDGVVWGPHKYRDLAKRVGTDRIVAVLDDELALVRQAKEVGVANVYLRDQPYNIWSDALGRPNRRIMKQDGVIRIDGNYDRGLIQKYLRWDVEEWREEHGR